MSDPQRLKQEDLLPNIQPPVAFKDVVICFSQSQWLDLDECEKMIYRKVIQEVHGALSMMGYIIGDPSIVFRIKAEEQDLGLTDSLDLIEKVHSSSHYKRPVIKRENSLEDHSGKREGGPPVEPSISLRAYKVCEPNCRDLEQPEGEDTQHARNTKSICPTFNPNLSPWIKELDDPYLNNEHKEERQLAPCVFQEKDSQTTKMEDERGSKPAEQLKELQSLLRTTREKVEPPAVDGSFFSKPSQSILIEANSTRDGPSTFPKCGAGFGVLKKQGVPRTPINKNKPYKCKDCEKSFAKRSYLTIHQRLHTGEKPFKCAQCNKGFSHKSNLNQHQITHTGERPFQCNLCEKRFNHKVSLNLHQQIHTGERPYECSVCGKGFRRNSDLLQHLKTHLRGKRRGAIQETNHNTRSNWQVPTRSFQESP